MTFAFLLTGCTGLFSTVFHQDDPSMFVAVEPKYRLPFSGRKNLHLLVQGVGGHFSHRGEYAYDWEMPIGTPVLTARDGVVSALRCGPEDRTLPLEKRPARFVRVRHDDGEVSCYAHLDSVAVAVGERVAMGDTVGFSGNTGFSTQPHLHFHVEKGDSTIPSAFTDVTDPDGIPRVGRFYPQKPARRR